MRTRTKGILVAGNGDRTVNKQYRGQRIFERLGRVSQDDAEAWLRKEQARLDDAKAQQLREADGLVTFREAGRKYVQELEAEPDVRTKDTISGHLLLLDQWVGLLPLAAVCNDSFLPFKADRLAGRDAQGGKARRVKPATVNRALEVARTVLNRAARVWRTSQGKPWLGAAPLIEMLDEEATSRKPRPITWAEQATLMRHLPAHLQNMVLFALNTGARDENVCGLKWEWEKSVPDAKRSVFVIPAKEFKSKREHVVILNDVAWRIVEAQRGRHDDFVFVYRRERVVVKKRKTPPMPYRRIDTMNNTGFQNAREAAGLSKVRVHDFRHTFAQRLRAAGVAKEDRNLLMGHASADMAEHYATSGIGRLVELANKVSETIDRTTLLRVVNG